MSSCNADPVKLEISPTTRAGCSRQSSCNARPVNPCLSSCDINRLRQNSRLVTHFRFRALAPPVARMGLAPLPNPGGIGGAAEVVPVLLLAQPAPLPPRLAGPATRRGRAMLLPVMGPGIGKEELPAVQALAFTSSSGSWHRPVLSKTADAGRRRPRAKENPPSKRTGRRRRRRGLERKGAGRRSGGRKSVFKPAALNEFHFAAASFAADKRKFRG